MARGRGSSRPVPDLIAFVLLLAITAYSTAGGVDFGAGIWDLMAGNSPRGREARALIDHAMAPVWEVNNVWLVLAIVLTWTGFPILFQQVFSSLYPLFTFALLGLVLRGAFFAFRHVAEEPRAHRLADVVFGLSSLLTPFFFAAAALIAVGTFALVAIWWHAPDLLRSMLAGKGLPFALATMILTPLATFLIWRGIFRWYRTLTVAAVGSMVFAWAVAQSPYLIPGQLTISQAIAPPPTQVLLLVVAAVVVLVIGPAMGLLYYLDQRSALESPES